MANTFQDPEETTLDFAGDDFGAAGLAQLATGDRMAPGVRISLLPDVHAPEGEPLNLAGRVLSMTFEEADEKADKMTLKLLNHDFHFFDTETLAPGALLELTWGYPGRTAPPRRVTIKKIKGFETLTVEGQALSALMDQEAKTRAWFDRTHSQVAREIAREHGYDVVAEIDETSEVIETINQMGETDARFLTRIARLEGFQFYVDQAGWHWHARRLAAAPTKTFVWRGNVAGAEVLSVSVESDLRRQTSKVVMRGRDPTTKQAFEVTADTDSVERDSLGTETIHRISAETGQDVEGGGLFDEALQDALASVQSNLEANTATETIVPARATARAAAQREAKTHYKRDQHDNLKLTLSVIGNPSLRAKTIVEVLGISAMLSGNYYLASVRHQLARGYTCQLKLIRDAHGRRARALGTPPPQRATVNATPGPGSVGGGDGGRPTIVRAVDAENGSQAYEFHYQDGHVAKDAEDFL